MSETPKPPEGYELWADFAVDTLLHRRHRDAAKADLAALRAGRDRLRELLARLLHITSATCQCVTDGTCTVCACQRELAK
jgi:hypothetical protein